MELTNEEQEKLKGIISKLIYKALTSEETMENLSKQVWKELEEYHKSKYGGK